MSDFHFLRPYWLFTCIPLIFLGYHLFKQKASIDAWRQVCDEQLLAHLLKIEGHRQQAWPLFIVMGSAFCMVIALAGPTWSRIPVPTYQQVRPSVLLLDMSEDMLSHDLTPDRLTRAKFKLQDILQQQDAGQFGLIVYTGEPFVVSPLTEDGGTIDNLLSSLTPSMMPVGGHRLDLALTEAQKLILDAGSTTGDILVLTAQVPSNQAVETAQTLAHNSMYTSVMPLLSDKNALPLFEPLAAAGQGVMIPIKNDNSDIEKWLKSSQTKRRYQVNDFKDIPLWRDEGRWFLLIALVLLLPVFWRGWLERINT